MRFGALFAAAFLALPALGVGLKAQAHFGAIIPESEIISLADDDDRRMTVELSFLHPMQRHLMEMGRPARFGVMARGKREELAQALESESLGDGVLWRIEYEFKRPGAHVFFLEPEPYWEPLEERYIVHYTKTVVGAFGLDAGWDSPVGFPVEIIPLTRPYGLWAGNLFQGIVKRKGEPVPFAEVEVEHLNEEGVAIPADPFITQIIRADARGLFSYAMPRAGWWGFAALIEGDKKILREGEARDVELGAVIWVRAREMK